MAIVRESPRVRNSTSTGAIVTGTSGPSTYFELAFKPLYLRLENLGTVDLWVQFNSTGAASTDDVLIRSCEAARVLELNFKPGVGPAVINFAATSTAASGASLLALGEP